jgi:ABC-type Fe2+-enterobactin transport system substrate-binding protein
MLYSTVKKIILNLLLIVSISNLAWAADMPAATTTPATTLPPAANPQSKAIEFARQAGTIAGVAQACGQNVADFTQRITEAVDKLALNPTDKAGALLVYQQLAREAQLTEQKIQSIPCTKVLQDFRNLPIMQADYREKVITQLNP